VSVNPDIQPTWPLLLRTEKVNEIVFLVGWMSGLTDTILKGGHQKTKQRLAPIGPVVSEMNIF
jgi:hypothetical protein